MADKGKSIFAIKPKETKISHENAVASVVELLQYYDFDVEAIADAKKKKTTLEQLEDVTKEFMKGTFELAKNADGAPEVVQHLVASGSLKEITYAEFSGKIRVASDGKDMKTEMFGAVYQMLGALTGLGPGIVDLRGPDMKAAEALGNLFFTLMS